MLQMKSHVTSLFFIFAAVATATVAHPGAALAAAADHATHGVSGVAYLPAAIVTLPGGSPLVEGDDVDLKPLLGAIVAERAFSRHSANALSGFSGFPHASPIADRLAMLCRLLI